MVLRNRFSLFVLILLAVLMAGMFAFSASAYTGSLHVVQLSPNGQGRAYAVAYSPDGRTLAVGSSLGIHFYNSSDLQPIRFIPTESWVRALAYSPDGSLLASGSYDPIVRLWRASDGTLIKELTGHSAWVRALAFSPNGKLLATASDDNTVRLWNVPDGSLFHIFDNEMEGVRAVAFSPDGSLMASGGFDNIIRLWQVSDGTLVRELPGSTGWIRALAFSPDGKWLASGGFDHLVHLWRVEDGELLVTREEHSSSITGLAFSPDGEILASADVDTTVRLWKMPTLEPYDMLRGHSDFVFSVAFSPDGKSLASGAADNTVRVWEVPTKEGAAAQERVTTPSDCKICHHPSGTMRPARVIETNCAACHPNGAQVLNWCPVLDRAPGGTTLEVSYTTRGMEGGVPKAAPDFYVVIASPGNGAHVYTPEEIIGTIPIVGSVHSENVALTDIKLQLTVWSGSKQVADLSAKPGSEGAFSFLANIRPGGGDPFVDLDGQKFLCANCHKTGQTVLPAGEVLLVVTATTPDGTQASDERIIYVDQSGSIPMQVNVLLEDGQPIAGVPLQASTRLYEWRAHTFTATSDSNGQASLQVEALSQNITTYKISVPPTVINGVLYQSKDSVQVTLPAGATTTPAVTLHLEAASGEISGQVSELDTPIQVWAIPLPDGDAHIATTSPEGTFIFTDLPVGEVMLVGDPQALAEQGMAMSAESIDLSQSLSVRVDLIPKPLEGESLNGKISDEAGVSLPFAWVNVATQIGKNDPASSAYALFGLSTGKVTAIISAPGYYSQADVINIQDTANPQKNFTLVRRPQTRIIPWGDGAIVVPPETVASLEGQRITFDQGWLWGKGESEEPVVVLWGDIQITIPRGQFALERLPAQSGWLYMMDGQASIQQAGTIEPIPVQAGEMVYLSQEQEAHPVPYDPVVVGALRLDGEVPIQTAWQLSLGAQVRDRLARIGIGTAQTVTFVTYFMEVLALLLMLILAINWMIKKNRKDKKSDQTLSD